MKKCGSRCFSLVHSQELVLSTTTGFCTPRFLRVTLLQAAQSYAALT